jgi:hypothetical protein
MSSTTKQRERQLQVNEWLIVALSSRRVQNIPACRAGDCKEVLPGVAHYDQGSGFSNQSQAATLFHEGAPLLGSHPQ